MARLADWVVRWVAPAATALAFVAVLFSERTHVEHDLQIVLPSESLPGRPVAIRAFLFTDLENPQGPRLTPARVRARLVTNEGRTLATTTLGPSVAGDIEGTLKVPPGIEGRFTVRAEARLGAGATAKVQAPLTVHARARPLEARGRLAHPLQQYTLFPIRPAYAEMRHAYEREGLVLEPRVSGGACVPEHECDLLVRRSDPRFDVSIDRSASAELVRAEPVAPTALIVPLGVLVHGPEGEAQVFAMSEGRTIARRTVRLPVALGTPVLRVSEVLQRAPARVSVRVEALEPGRALIIDAFRNGYWERTGSARPQPADAENTELTLPFEPLDEGTWRIQVRTDPFSAASAATRFVHVRAPSDTESTALRALLSNADPDERRALTPSVTATGKNASAFAAYLLSPKELDVVPQPLALQGAVQATWGVDDRKRSVRVFAIVVVVLCGLLVVSVLLRRGLRAAAEARRIVEQIDDDGGSTRHLWSTTVQVVALVAVVGLVFLAVVMMMLARGGF